MLSNSQAVRWYHSTSISYLFRNIRNDVFDESFEAIFISVVSYYFPAFFTCFAQSRFIWLLREPCIARMLC